MSLTEDLIDDLTIFQGRLQDAIDYNANSVEVFKDELLEQLQLIKELLDDI